MVELILILMGGWVVWIALGEYVRQRRYDRAPEFESRGKLVSRRTKGETHYGKPYTAYYGTFETEQGDLLELRMHRDPYYNLSDGASGILTWKDGKLEEFREVEQ